ncbi:MAG: hypothetical protein AAGD25_01705 [Cyanobacteria bacterium P01_F01_bin.150]
MKNGQLPQLKSTIVSTLVLVLIPFLVGCSGEQPERTVDNATNDATAETPNVINSSDSMNIEGTITEVMESWPLQLSVETTTGQYHIELLSETTITQDGNDVEADRLIPNVQVLITGQASTSQENAMIADSIEIK